MENEPINYKQYLEHFVELYRTGAIERVILLELEALSKEWEKCGLLCESAPVHQRSMHQYEEIRKRISNLFPNHD